MSRKKCRDIKILTDRYKARLKKRKPDYELVSEYNDKVVDIKHKKCNNVFPVSPNYILYYGSCPKCNKEEKQYKISKKEIEKINKFKEYVEDVTNGDYIVTGNTIDKKTRKINIKHSCGHEYGIRMCMFKKGRRCPICTKTKYKTHEQYKKEFEDASNGDFILLTKYEASTKKIKILHKGCNNHFDILPGNFIKDPRCSICEKRTKSKKKTN